MRRIVIALATGALLAGASPGHADQGPGRRGDDRGEQVRGPPSPQRDGDRARDARDHDDRGAQRRGSLSPEDRRQLRRDISNHGRDIYRDRGRDQR